MSRDDTTRSSTRRSILQTGGLLTAATGGWLLSSGEDDTVATAETHSSDIGSAGARGRQENAPFAPDDHDHSGQRGGIDQLGVENPVASIAVDRVATPSRSADVVVWKDGEGTIYADGSETITTGSDAATVIQTALDGLTEGREHQEVVQLKGDFTFSTAVTVPSNVMLEIRGRITPTDELSKTTSNALFTSTDTTNITIQGGTLEGTAPESAGYGRSGHESAGFSAFWFEGVTDVDFANLRIKTYVGNGIRVTAGSSFANDKSRRVRVLSCKISNAIRGVHFKVVHDALIASCIANETGFDGYDVDAFCNDVLVADSIAKDNARSGVFVEVSSSNVVIDSGIYEGNQHGVFVNGHPEQTTEFVTINSVICRHNRNRGIFLQLADGGGPTEEEFEKGDTRNILVTNCQVNGNGQKDDPQFPQAGIFVAGGNVDLNVRNCVATDNQESKTQPYGIGGWWGSTGDVTIVGNDFEGNAEDSVFNLENIGESTVEFRDNQGAPTRTTGTATFSGDGSSSSFTIGAHGLATAPASRSDVSATLTPSSGGAIDATPATVYPVESGSGDGYDALEVSFASPPESGDENVALRWTAELTSFWG